MTYIDEVLADAPLAYWKLDESAGATTAADSSGNGRTFPYAAGVQLGQPSLVPASTQSARSQDASTRIGIVPYASWMNVTALTVEVWLKNQVSSGVRGFIGRFASFEGAWAITHNGSIWQVLMRLGGSFRTINGPAVDTWPHHMAITYDGATFAYYVDGALYGSQAFAATLSTTATNTIEVGSYGAGSYSNALLSDAAVYGTALSAARILAHYNAARQVAAPTSGYAAAVLADAPSAYWKLDGTAADSSGNARHGSFATPPVSAGSLLAAGGGSAVDFDGVDDSVGVPSGSWMNLSAFTVEAWIRFDTNTGSHGVVSRWPSSTGADVFLLRVDVVSGAMKLLWSTFRTTGSEDQLASAALTPGVVYHVVGTYDVVAGMRLHINGVQVATRAVSGALPTPTTPIYIGRIQNAAGWFFDGVIDEVAFYPTALSATRIQAHFDAAAAPPAITVAGQAAQLGVTGLDGTPITPIRVPGEPAVATVTALDGTPIVPVDEPIVVAGEPATLGVTTVDGAVGGYVVAGEPAALSVVANDGQVVGAPLVIVGEPAVLSVTALDGVLEVTYGTRHRRLDVNSRRRTGEGFVDLEIPVAPEPPGVVRAPIVTQVERLPDPEIMGDGVVEAMTPNLLHGDDWGRPRVRVGNTDATYFRGKLTLVPGWQNTDPYGHGPATLKFPQISFYEFNDIGTGALRWLHKNASVDLDHIKDGAYVDTLWSGHIDAFSIDDDGALLAECAGELSGRMEKTQRTQRLVRRVHDIGFLAKIAVSIPNKRYRVPSMGAWDGKVGQDVENTGGGMDTNLAFLDFLMSQAVEDDLDSWTILPVAGRRRHYDLVKRDRTTVDATVYLGARGVSAKLRDDQMEQPNRFFGEGVAPDGCFPAGTFVRGAKIERGYRRWHSGELVTIQTAGGQELTGTPNHPVLTPHGWVPLGLVEEGFGVFRSGTSHREPPRADPDVEDVPARIEQVVDALAQRGRTQRVGVGVVDLHGEGRDREVDVVDPLGVLRHHGETQIAQPASQLGLTDADRLGTVAHGLRASEVAFKRDAAPLLGRGGAQPQRGRLARTAPHNPVFVEDRCDAMVADAQPVGDRLGGLSGEVVAADGGLVDARGAGLGGDSMHLGPPRSTVHPRRPSPRCLAACAQLNAGLPEPLGDCLRVDAQVAADALGGLSGEVAADYVVHVERTSRPTHVYNLQTATGAYTAGGLVVHNSRWRGAVYPNLGPEVPPPYPYADNRVFGADGLTDDDTDTGAGMSVLEDELVGSGLLSLHEANNEWGPATTDAIEETQRRATLPVTGRVDTETWAAVFGDGISQQRLTQGHIMPLVWDPRTERRKLAPNGSFIGLSPVYDENVPRIERKISYGEGVTKRRARVNERREMNRAAGPNVRGTITLQSDVMAGEHTYGQPGTPMSRLDLREGMNVKVARMGSTSGQLMHVSALTGSGLDGQNPEVELAVDSQFRDYITLAEMLERDRAARLDPARQFRNQHRRSTIPSDSIIPFDREAGAGHVKRHPLKGGQWNAIPVVGGQSGEIQRLELMTFDAPAEFIMMIAALPVRRGMLSKRVGNPFATASGAENIWSKQEVADWLAGTRKKNRDKVREHIEESEQAWDESIEDAIEKREKRIAEAFDQVGDDRIGVYVAGTTEQPCGYWPHVKTNSDGERTEHPITGLWRDDASFSFWTLGPASPLLYLAVFPDRDCTIRGHMYDQLSEGV